MIKILAAVEVFEGYGRDGQSLAQFDGDRAERRLVALIPVLPFFAFACTFLSFHTELTYSLKPGDIYPSNHKSNNATTAKTAPLPP